MEAPETRKPLSMLDKFGTVLSDRAVDRVSRRHVLYRLAAGAAGLFSVGITTSSIINIGGRAYAQSNPSPPPPCSHNGTGIQTDSIYCGLHGNACSDLRSCTGNSCTWVGACPAGTSPRGPTDTNHGTYPWRACCLCSGATGDTGEIFMYQDCCGSQTSGIICGTRIKACQGTNYHDAGNRCPRQMNWCDYWQGGTYYCTVALGPQGPCHKDKFCDCIDDNS
jgi:hypothetical protein